VEVQQDICDLVTGRLSRMGIQAELRRGTNRDIPFPDDYIDCLVSWDVVHYETCDENIRSAIEEYRRVLKPGGRFFLSTVAPNNAILDGAETLGHHRYKIRSEDDFRKGEIFFCFDAPHYIENCFSNGFRDVHVGRTTSDLFKKTIDCFLATGIKA